MRFRAAFVATSDRRSNGQRKPSGRSAAGRTEIGAEYPGFGRWQQHSFDEPAFADDVSLCPCEELSASVPEGRIHVAGGRFSVPIVEIATEVLGQHHAFGLHLLGDRRLVRRPAANDWIEQPLMLESLIGLQRVGEILVQPRRLASASRLIAGCGQERVEPSDDLKRRRVLLV